MIEHKWEERIQKLNLAIADIFNDAEELFNEKVQHQSKLALKLNGKIEALSGLYMSIKDQASSVDPTLQVHVQALEKQAIYKLQKLENKMLRAEKRKFDDTRKQIAFLKASLFPKNGLQERVENIGYYYAKFGKGIIDAFYQHSLATEQEFTILKHVSG
jgi:uncharacterized protein YllA (UPF0747 family)